jgi:hypothetical protein
MKALKSDDKLTVRRWADIIASGGNATLGLSIVFQRLSNLIEKGIVRGIGGKVIGGIGAIAGVISGIMSIKEQYQLGDGWGIGLSVASTVGSTISVVGFLMSAAAASSATGVGAPVGIVLMVIGVIISLVAGIVSLVREWRKVKSEEVFKAYLEFFGKSASFWFAARESSKLKKAYDDVKSGIDDVDFWYASKGRASELFDIGFYFKKDDGSFNVGAIANIVDDDEDHVLHLLRKLDRIK